MQHSNRIKRIKAGNSPLKRILKREKEEEEEIEADEEEVVV